MSVRTGLIHLLCILFLFPIYAAAEQLDDQWLNQKLHKYKPRIELWQNGWLAVHGTSAVADAYRASRTHNRACERVHAVSAASAALGAADLLFRPVIPNQSNDDPEQQMRTLAENIRWRKSWKGHFDGWLTAIAGAFITAAGPGKDSDAVEFFLLAGLVTELEIWSLPSGAVKDWDRYLSGHHEGFPSRKRDSSPSHAPLVQTIPHGLKLTWLF
ncbi:hypothetical protein M3P05_18135 [Sansalvadorimonas sp. 2012CJ34-2]|uniref:Uncharacterized protein n=1 Tax=Parendozoicomonas callyspongiae TaxID=2942213 RepID=A0ABT0PMZ3_9GAMM|nr:hypothetical protein [Sansalvadorimonas sp. 2012CJ34-2]MCL6271843.1 hypothetical protein [Sansalvadorimonas sp. 2012CJ34-2]